MFGNGSKDEDNRAAEEGKLHFEDLRAANVARQAEWDGDSKAQNLKWRANELFGEAGEAANIIKKLHRERVGIRGSRATLTDLAEELADIVICLDLFAMTADIAMVENYYETESAEPTTLLRAGTWIGVYVGDICHYALFPISIHKKRLLDSINELHKTVVMLARSEGIDLRTAVAAKFNATSVKMGLTVRLRYRS